MPVRPRSSAAVTAQGTRLRVMARLRSLAISILHMDGHFNIAAPNRHHARDPRRTLQLLQTA
jgi:hypothetical protein